ncbi:uncharacterized protein VTP21DRAFT_11233 [Calcarisporiella thermophila]|uniref:uncharacterized protein n=1 Tax=Calcarisporiella thermophila TaxID=911321 RepID=UPI0037448924
MSNPLLLRLFTSEHFNSWIAVSYLFRYPDSVGIQHYLCNELKRFPNSEIEFFLPQLVHLLVTRPSESVALESFIIDKCKESSHIAVLCLWFLQAYVSDLSATPHSQAFTLCKRLLNKSQAIVLGEDDLLERSETASISLGLPTYRVRENTFPAVVGMGIMAAAIGAPFLLRSAGQLAIAQGRRVRTLDGSTPSIESRSSLSPSLLSTHQPTMDIPRSSSFAFSSQPDLHRHSSDSGSEEDVSVKNPPSERRSSEGLRITNSLPSLAAALPQQSNTRNRRIKSSSFQSEMQFILALVDISTRLMIVPKAARISALHAELTLLNRNLPAEICIPMWCTASSNSNCRHHRVVRIASNEAVVLNSAERVPYLLFIEILDDDAVSSSNITPKKSNRRRIILESNSELKASNEQSKPERSSSIVIESDKMNDTLPLEADKIVISSIPITKEDSNKNIGDEDESSKPPIRPESTQAVTISSTQSVEDPTHTSSKISNSASSSTRKTKIVRHRSDSTSDEFASKMRAAAIMLAQLQRNQRAATQKKQRADVQKFEAIRQKILNEMMALEERRVTQQQEGEVEVVDVETVEIEGIPQVNKDDPSAAVFQEDWEAKQSRVRESSPYGHLSNWRLLSVIVKHGSDLRQEQLATQLIREMQRIWEEAKVPVWVKYFRVLVTSDNAGLIETVQNSISVHSIKKDAYKRGYHSPGVMYTLYDHFVRTYGDPSTKEFQKAQDCFMRSLVAYSIICYLLSIKDRHNGNVLLDKEGHLIHIDFGFMLSNSPGSVGFEMAPFKLPQEYIDILGGLQSELFAEFRALMKRAFLAVRKHCDRIILLVEMMQKDSKLACFSGEYTLSMLRERFQLSLTEVQIDEFVDRLIISSYGNVFTKLYDTFQYYSQGIL